MSINNKCGDCIFLCEKKVWFTTIHYCEIKHVTGDKLKYISPLNHACKLFQTSDYLEKIYNDNYSLNGEIK